VFYIEGVAWAQVQGGENTAELMVMWTNKVQILGSLKSVGTLLLCSAGPELFSNFLKAKEVTGFMAYVRFYLCPTSYADFLNSKRLLIHYIWSCILRHCAHPYLTWFFLMNVKWKLRLYHNEVQHKEDCVSLYSLK